MNLPDHQHQQRAEAGQAPVSADERAYQHIFRALQKSPGSALPPGFADRVMQRIMQRQAAYNRAERAWFAVGVAVFVLAALVSVLLTGFRFQLTFLDPVKGLILTGIVMAVLFQWIDKRWIRPAQR